MNQSQNILGLLGEKKLRNFEVWADGSNSVLLIKARNKKAAKKVARAVLGFSQLRGSVVEISDTEAATWDESEVIIEGVE